MRRLELRWLASFGGSFVFLFLVGQANHYLADMPLFGGTVHLFALGLPVAFAALRLSLGQGIAATLATAFLAEAGLPFVPGTLVLPATGCLCLAHAARVNFNRLNSSSALTAALAINLVLMAVLTVAARPYVWSEAWPRMLVDVALSQVFVAALTGWFFAAQIALLGMFGFNLETELRESP